MMHSVMCTSAPQARSYIFVSDKPRSVPDAIAHMPKTAITAHSKRNAPPVPKVAASVGVSTSSTWIESEATIRLSPTRKPYASARSGSNHYLLKAKTGMACGGSAYDDSGGSTVKD